MLRLLFVRHPSRSITVPAQRCFAHGRGEYRVAYFPTVPPGCDRSSTVSASHTLSETCSLNYVLAPRSNPPALIVAVPSDLLSPLPAPASPTFSAILSATPPVPVLPVLSACMARRQSHARLALSITVAAAASSHRRASAPAGVVVAAATIAASTPGAAFSPCLRQRRQRRLVWR